jgi:hypothetical protein
VLIKKYPESKVEIEHQLNNAGYSVANVKFLPVLSRGSDWIVVIDANTAKPLFLSRRTDFSDPQRLRSIQFFILNRSVFFIDRFC